METFKNKGFVIGNILHITPKEAIELCKDDAILVDVREEFMIGYKRFSVNKVIYAPASIIEEFYLELPTTKLLIISDATGIYSKEVTLFLTEKGFKNIANSLQNWHSRSRLEGEIKGFVPLADQHPVLKR